MKYLYKAWVRVYCSRWIQHYCVGSSFRMKGVLLHYEVNIPHWFQAKLK